MRKLSRMLTDSGSTSCNAIFKMNQLEMMAVRTRLPFPCPPNTQRPELRSERLLIRALRQSDLEALHRLRSQPEPMSFTRTGVVDADMAMTQSRLDLWLAPNDLSTYNCAILSRETGHLLGIGGLYYQASSDLGWPELGYMFGREAWGQGYATEFLRVWLDEWWKLPRREMEIQAARATLDVSLAGETNSGVPIAVPETIAALTEVRNVPSHRVLQKCGFTEVARWTEAATGMHLIGWTLRAPATGVQE